MAGGAESTLLPTGNGIQLFPLEMTTASRAQIQPSVSILIPKLELTHFVSWFSVQRCIVKQQEQLAWVTSLVWSTGWDIFSHCIYKLS